MKLNYSLIRGFFSVLLLSLPLGVLAKSNSIMDVSSHLIMERSLFGAIILILIIGLVISEVVRKSQKKRNYQSYNAQKEKIAYLEEKLKETEKRIVKSAPVNKPKVVEEETMAYTSSRLRGVGNLGALKVQENDDLGDLTMVSTHNIGKKREIQPKELVEATIETAKKSLPENVSIATQIGGAPVVVVNQNLLTKSLSALIRCSANTIKGNGKITVSLYASMGEAQISISDNGQGWGYKGQSSEELKALELAKKILLSQGATFEMNTQEKKGTEMVISISSK
ncbi:HAMP domain-containing histidine kinase [Flammeovirga pectinis]|uniref:HAMP domain-containing histidine kinase n=1 Tax=Flammeovirga pectinis TaxID=2494373 RepID=A0A3Q9FP22_9BACT|nr:HAMP domain-containing histidine kinase [Flammeovirga pectinis]AZQ61587.1 HAMP domain-containing histidine kinase [Flammeovirga pectinis]